jgi:hypothetical protein
MARPTKLTPDVKDRILAATRAGCTRSAAAAHAGIGEATLYSWIAKGRDAETGVYAEFVEDLTRAEAAGEARLTILWSEAAKTDWRAARDLLARRYPDKWAQERKAPGRPVGAVSAPDRVAQQLPERWQRWADEQATGT